MTILLSLRARITWTHAYASRRNPNWGRALNHRSLLKRDAKDGHPRIRKIATDALGLMQEEGRAA